MKPIGKLLWAALCLMSADSMAQTKNIFYIQFTDKNTEFKATEMLSEKSIERRTKFSIAYDSTDYPLNKNYVVQVLSDTSLVFRYGLKWHNAIIVESYNQELASLTKLPFVKKVAYVGQSLPKTESNEKAFISPRLILKDTEIRTADLNPENYGVAYSQNKQIGVTKLHKMGFDGKGVHLAVFDAGFFNIDKIPAFAKAQSNGLLTYGSDVVDLDVKMNDKDNHGTAVSSCIGAYDVNKYIGSAPQAKLFLFRTENAVSEYPIEELNWCKAAEIADSAGMDMITSSLGYNQYDDETMSYTWDNLDGRTSYVSLAARLAVEKGIFVLNSAGNEGDKKWRKIGTPADVPEVLTVGAADIKNKIGSFSSQGYNAAGQIKPDVCALGVKASVASTYGSYYQGYGTSYATPIAAGGVACLVQAFPNLPPQKIADVIRQTASKSSNPDSLYGFGIARFDLAYEVLKQQEIKNSTPYLVQLDKDLIILFTGTPAEIDYELLSNQKFLWIFNRKTLVGKGHLIATGVIVDINLDKLNIKCNKKYTLKVNLGDNVEKQQLKFSDLSLCNN